MANVSFGQLADPAEQDIQRRLAMAQALQQQSASPIQQQTAGGRAVKISPFEGLAKIAQALAAGKMNTDAGADQKALADRKREQGASDIEGIIKALRGTPAQTYSTGANEMGDEPATQNIAAQAPDQAKAFALALKSENPMAQGIGSSLLSTMLPKTAKWEKVEKPNADGSKQVGFVDVNSPKPWDTFTAGGTAPVKREFVNGQGVNPYTGDTQGGAIPKQPDAPNPRSDLLVDDGTGRLVPNKPLVDVKTNLAKAGKADIRVDARNYNTQESEQSKVYGKGLGEIRTNINQAGFDAPKKIAQLDRMEQLLAGIDGGAAAPALADVASLAQSFGIKLDPKLGAKQAAEALTREMAGSLRQPGTGPMTDKDFDNFLKQVPSLSKTSEGRAQITKTMRAAIERDLRASQFARDYAKKNGGVIDDNFFDSMAGFYSQNPVVTPQMPATNARGSAFSDPGKEKRYQEWLKSQNK